MWAVGPLEPLDPYIVCLLPLSSFQQLPNEVRFYSNYKEYYQFKNNNIYIYIKKK